MARMLDGKTLAETIRGKVKTRVRELGNPPGLAVILVGDDPASHLYVHLKQKACEEAGIRFEKFAYPADVSGNELIEKINELNARADVTGILVQLPLPSQNADHVIAAIDPKKDVDGFHPENIKRLRLGDPAIAPAVALGVMKLIDAAGEALRGKTAAIVGSELFAEPLHILLREHGVTSETVAPHDPAFAEKTRGADILVVAVGIPNLVNGAMVKPGAIVIDVGTTKVNGKLAGDADRASVEPVAGHLTPVPGGVGPMTVAMLLLNILKAHQLRSE